MGSSSLAVFLFGVPTPALLLTVLGIAGTNVKQEATILIANVDPVAGGLVLDVTAVFIEDYAVTRLGNPHARCKVGPDIGYVDVNSHFGPLVGKGSWRCWG